MAITGNIPLIVEFSDTSTGDNLTYLWDFGDGQTSSEQNPTHEYSSAGDFTVSLTTTNNYGSDTKTDTVSATSTAGTTGTPGGGRGDTPGGGRGDTPGGGRGDTPGGGRGGF